MKKTAKTRKDTVEIAQTFLKNILSGKEPRGARIVGLSGNLGAGKTAFVKAVARHLGVRGVVNSPTFVIIKKYPIKKEGPHKFLFHMDAYRLKNARELIALGWKDIVADERNLVFIEWPEQVSAAMPKHARRVHIAHAKGKHRTFKLN
jgi:tRNA threonylcarbamoyladenosine biosynthesis protein TsaE